jgi:hypothetical protein
MSQTQGTTNTCYAVVAKRMIGTEVAAFHYIALDEAIAPAYDESTTALVAECTKTGLERASATMSTMATTVADDTMQATHQFTAGAKANIRGFAIFNDASAGDMAMWCRFSDAIPLVEGDLLTITGKIQIKQVTQE